MVKRTDDVAAGVITDATVALVAGDASAHIPVAPATLAPAVTFTTPWTVVVDAYLAGAVESLHTRRAYRRHLVEAFATIGRASLAELTGADLVAYRAAVTAPGRSRSGAAQALAALRACLRWARALGAHQLADEFLAAALKTPRTRVQRPYTTLSQDEVAALLAAATTPRDRALLAVLLGAGLRAAELTALDAADLRTDGDGGIRVLGLVGGTDITPVAPASAHRSTRATQPARRHRLAGITISAAD